MPTYYHYHLLECMTCHAPTLQQWNTPYKEELLIDEPRVLFPTAQAALPMPAADMPADVASDYNEARLVLAVSPRSSAALLRLALQKLCKLLGEDCKDINHDIGQLVQKGLSPQVQQAMDTVRIVGNNSVHPGELDVRDNRELAQRLFPLVNLMVYEMITRPRELAELYGTLPQYALDAVERRDKGNRSQ